ncbi:site-specific integrase [Methylobacterium sp. WCS2018Hpa-22]|uniref:tyrosine-type recombinase/integrase n=1 Tax=Methylobacterium sp. WCS2018Hpa-22 TaxID=3073633 RepID=UPI00288A0C76|nr:site-specific integrase [Methylobacterium sp. WCS2018Hpa-22]
MGSITTRKRKDGTSGFTARVRVMQDGRSYHESQTFDRRTAAVAWIKRRETELSSPGGLAKLKGADPTLSEVIDRYVETTIKQIGKTKAQVLRTIKKHAIAALRCSEVRSDHIVDFAHGLAQNVQAQTVGNYLSHLSAIFAVARPAWGYPLDEGAMRDAMAVSKRLGLKARSRKRTRRPRLEELDRILTHFEGVRHRRPSSLPMVKIIVFALFSTRRQEEIIRIKWDDLDEEASRVMVRNMKNPGQKVGNDVWCELPPEALAVIRSMPRSKGEIFPYSTDAISISFTRACALLGIEDLHFHDLRHEGVSRLFEMGATVPLAAAVSGHRSWQSLQRYAHVRRAKDKYDGWKWLAVAPEQ